MAILGSNRAFNQIKAIWGSRIQVLGRAMPAGPILAGTLATGLYGIHTHKEGHPIGNITRDFVWGAVGTGLGAAAHYGSAAFRHPGMFRNMKLFR